MWMWAGGGGGNNRCYFPPQERERERQLLWWRTSCAPWGRTAGTSSASSPLGLRSARVRKRNSATSLDNLGLAVETPSAGSLRPRRFANCGQSYEPDSLRRGRSGRRRGARFLFLRRCALTWGLAQRLAARLSCTVVALWLGPGAAMILSCSDDPLLLARGRKMAPSLMRANS